MTLEITLESKVYRDGDELMVLNKDERKALDAYIDLLILARQMKKALQPLT